MNLDYLGCRDFAAENFLQKKFCKHNVAAMRTVDAELAQSPACACQAVSPEHPAKDAWAGSPPRPVRGAWAGSPRRSVRGAWAGSPPRPAGGVWAGLPPRSVRYARLVAQAVGGFLLPWCVLLGLTLPGSAHVQHWWLAWVGLDGGEAAMAFATAGLLARSDVRASLTAMAGAALLLTDAWFDVCTSAGGADQLISVAEAAFAEVPLAVAAVCLAVSLLRARAGDSVRQSP
jgi:hypothetical protein